MGTSRRGGAVFNCPSAWRISQSLIASGRKQKNIQTHFHQCFFFFLLPSCYSLSVASTSGLFAPLSLSISYPHSLFPFPSLSLCVLLLTCCIFWLSLRRWLFVLYVFAQIYNHCVHCNVCICWDSIPEFKGLSPQIWFFLSISLLFHNSSTYPFSRSEQEKAGQASSPSKSCFEFCLTYALNPCVIFQVIPALSTKTYCLLSFRGGIFH